MATTQGSAPDRASSPAMGVLSLVMGLLACAGVAAIWLTSTTVDLPDWLRVTSGWGIPVGIVGAVVFGVMARARRAGAGLALAGFALAAAAVVAFAVMILSNPY